MTHRLSMAPRVAQRFGVHLRPHVIALSAFVVRRIGIVCLVVGALLLLSSASAPLRVAVEVAATNGASGWTSTVDGVLTDPATPQGVTVRTYGEGSSSGALTLEVGDPTAVEQFLAGAGAGLVWLSVGAACAWLSPLLRRFAEGEPFARGNARRLRSIAGAVLVATHVAPLAAPLGATLALARLDVHGFTAAWGFPVHTSLLVVPVLLLLAGALQQGRDLQDDVAGLV